MRVVGKRLLATAMVCGLTACVASDTSASAATGCDLYASPSGSDSASGQLSKPLASIAALDRALAPGQTGCVEAGTYGNTSPSGWTSLAHSGTPGGQITITPAPGQTVKIVGLIAISGSYTTLSGFDIDGSNTVYHRSQPQAGCPSTASDGLEIDGHNDVFENNDLHQSIPGLRGNGIGIGWNGQADNTVIRYNRIHDVGQCMAYDQIIYLSHGDNVQIYDNWLWDDPHGWGVQVYPAATDAHIYDNVIDDAGSGFVVGGSSEVSGNTIDHNIVMNSTGLVAAGLARGVGVSTCCGLGPGNSFTDNVVYGNPGGVSDASGIAQSGNRTLAPALADPQDHDFRVTSSTPLALAGWGLWDGNLSNPTASPARAVRTFHRSRVRVARSAHTRHRTERRQTRRRHTKHRVKRHVKLRHRAARTR